MKTMTYVLSYNTAATNFNINQLHVFIERSRDIQSWYFAFPGTYLIKSNQLLVSLTVPFRQFFGDTHYVLTFAVPTLISGSLPPAVWEWVNADNIPSLGSDS